FQFVRRTTPTVALSNRGNESLLERLSLSPRTLFAGSYAEFAGASGPFLVETLQPRPQWRFCLSRSPVTKRQNGILYHLQVRIMQSIQSGLLRRSKLVVQIVQEGAITTRVLAVA